MGNRVKKYRMKAIPSTFSEKGGFNAQFIGDGYSVDARTEILPAVIVANGVQVGEGTAWDLVNAFLKACAQRAANTGETVNVGSLLSFGLAIKGWYANRDSRAAKDSVRVTATLLGDLKPTVAFSMSNEVDGASIVLLTVMSPGCGLGHVRQGAEVRINGKALRMLEGDAVTAALKTAGGETVIADCPVTESDDDHIDVTLPEAFSPAEFVGREVRFTVRGRGGDPDATPEEKSISAILDGAGPGPEPTEPITFDFAQTEGVNEGQVNETADTLLHVSEGCEIPAWGAGDSITLTGRGQTWTMPTPVVDTDSMTYGFQIPQDVGGTLEEDDPCEFNIRSGGRTGTLAAVWRH